jgi:tripartite-type tricarboxylate transporter receptor subunit TctC
LTEAASHPDSIHESQGVRVKLAIATALATSAVLALAGGVEAQGSPEVNAQGATPIRIIAPYAAGGAVDMVSRLIAHRLAEVVRRPVIVENKPGAGSVVGSTALVGSAPDGNTLMMANIALSANPSLHKSKLPYDVTRDFAPVIQVADLATVLIVNPSIHADTAAEFVALAKSRPGKLNIGSAGFGSVNHLAAELFMAEAAVDLVHVPYQGGAPALMATATGQVDCQFITLPPTLPFINSGRVRALAVTSAKRSPLLPDVPTLAESALPGFELTEWYGIVAPARTPKATIESLNAAFNRVLQMPDVRDQLAKAGADVVGGPPAVLEKRIQADLVRWSRTIKPEMRVE